MLDKFGLHIHDFLQLFEEPWVKTGEGFNFIMRHTLAQRMRRHQQAHRRCLGQRGAHIGPAFIGGHIWRIIGRVQTGQAGLQRAQCFLQAFFEVAANSHGFANRFHGRGEVRLSAREFFKSKTRDFGYNIVNGRLKARGCNAGNVIH